MNAFLYGIGCLKSVAAVKGLTQTNAVFLREYETQYETA